MPGAIIAIDQDRPLGTSTGTPGEAREDLWQNRIIRPRVTTVGNTSQQWTLLDVPPGSTAVLSDATLTTCYFTPDLPGSYRLRLITNGGGNGNVAHIICAVRYDTNGVLVQRGWRVPAYGETPPENNFGGQLRGWAQAMERILDDVVTGLVSGTIGALDFLEAGAQKANRHKLNFANGFTVTDNIGQSRVDVSVNPLGGPALIGVQGAVLVEDPIGVLGYRRLQQADIDPDFDISTFAKSAPNGATLLYERGDTITTVTAAATYVNSYVPDSASIANSYGGSSDGGDINGGAWTINTPFASGSMAGSVKRSGTDLGADPTWTVTLTATKGTITVYKSFTVTFTRRFLWGVGAAGLTDLTTLPSSALQTSRVRNITVSPANQKVHIAYPKLYGAATIKFGGLPFDMLPVVERTATFNGVLSTFYHYESTNLLTASNMLIEVT